MELRIKDAEFNEMIKKFQEGGEMAPPPEELMPAQEEQPQGGDQMLQLIEMFAQGLQNQDCNLLAQAALIFLLAVGGGGGAPAEALEAPVYKRGGRLLRWERKSY